MVGMALALDNTPEVSAVFAKHLTLKTIDKCLNNDGAVLISFAHNDDKHRHVFLCVSRTEKTYVGVNLFLDETVSRLYRRKMSRLLRQKNKGYGNHGWFVSKETI